MQPLNVGIAGAGTAGAAAGTLLARAGHTVTIYEEAADPRPIGAGIMLQPSGVHALHAMGLAETVVEAGSTVRGLFAKTDRGRTLLDIRYGTLSPQLYGVGLHRGVLFVTLFRAAQEAGVEIRTGTQITGIAGEPGARRLVDKNGEAHGPHDLLIVADGSRSSLREAAGVPHRIVPYEWGALWFIGEDRDRAAGDRLYQVVRKGSIMLGLLPTGHAPESEPGSPPLASIYWGVRMDRVDEFRAGEIEAWKKTVRGLMPETEGVLDQITSHEQVLAASYVDAQVGRWHTEDVVLLGDAAHATSPQLGQGCNMALVDAGVLAQAVAESDSVAAALKLWAARRRAQVRYYQWATRFLTPMFQTDGWFWPTLRDIGFPIARWLPLMGGEMVRTMAGLKRGILRRSMPLQPILDAMPPATEPSTRLLRRGD